MPIHPTAVVDRHAELAADVDIGPHVCIEGPVRIGAGTRIYASAYVSGWTTIGANCQIHPGAVVGHLPQDFHYHGDKSYCRIGDGTVIREFASVHRGTQPESATVLGRDCLLLGYAHVGHNCILDDGAKVYNNSLLSGHVEIGAGAIVSGLTAVHQFVRIGELVMVGGASRVTQDIPPYLSFAPGMGLYGVNITGLRRAEVSGEAMRELDELYRLLFRSGLPLGKALEQVVGRYRSTEAQRLIAFCRSPSKRGFAGGPDRERSKQSRSHAEA